MSARLVTHISDELPKVLVIGDDSWVFNEVQSLFRRFDFSVVQTTYSELTTALLLSEDWYKVVVVFGFEKEHTQSALELVRSRLSLFSSVQSVRPRLPKSTVFISPNWTHFLSTIDTKTSDYLHALREVQCTINDNTVGIVQLCIENLVSSYQIEHIGLTAVPPLEFCLSGRKERKIRQFPTAVSFLSEKQCSFYLAQFLRKPSANVEQIIKNQEPLSKKLPKTILIKGKEFRNTDIAQEIARRVYIQFGERLDSIQSVFSDTRKPIDFIDFNWSAFISDSHPSDTLPQLIQPIFDHLFVSHTSFFSTSKQHPPTSPRKHLTKTITSTQSIKADTPSAPPLIAPTSLQKNNTSHHVNKFSNELSGNPVNEPPNNILGNSPNDLSQKSTNDLSNEQATGLVKKDIPTEKKNPVEIQNSTEKQVNAQRQVSAEKQISSKKHIGAEQHIDKKLQSLFSVERVVKKVDHLADLHTKTTKATKKNKKRRTAFYVGTVISGIAAATLFSAGTFLVSTFALKSTLLDFVQEVVEVEKSFQDELEKKLSFSDLLAISDQIKLLSTVVSIQLNVYSQIFPPAFFYDATRLLSVIESIDSASELFDLLSKQQRLEVLGWLGAGGHSNQENIVSSQETYEQLSQLHAQIQELMQTSELQSKTSQLQSFLAFVHRVRSNVLAYQQIEPFFSPLFGYENKRTYALVFQNEHELRATGGFIQAIALVTFEEGVLIDSQVFSSYQLDGLLAAIIDPPEEITQQLGETRYYLRDANWDPDFPTTASQLNWFIEQTLNRQVDGVIALNGKALSHILSGLGPLEILQYNEIVTDKNIAERLEFHSEVTLVETSESNDYAVLLMRSLLQKATSISPDRVPFFLAGLQRAVQEKQLFVHMFEEQESVLVANLGWSGSLISPSCPTQLNVVPCLVDTIAVIDSNVGVNKANYHLKRQDSHSIILETDVARHLRTISLQNTAQSNAWPKGSYISYLRFYLPITSTDVAFTVNDQKIATNELVTYKQGEFQVFGLRTTTPIQTTTAINLEYSTPLTSEQRESTELSYVFFAQKQAGTGTPLRAVTISYPPSLQPAIIAPQAAVDLDSITFTNLGREHIFVGSTYQKMRN